MNIYDTVISQVYLAVQRSCGTCYHLPSETKGKNTSSHLLLFEISVWAGTIVTQLMDSTVYVSSPANTPLVGVLTLSFLLKTHASNGLKPLTSKGGIFHHWPVAKPEDFCFQNKNILFTSQKKSVNLSETQVKSFRYKRGS